MIVWFKQLSQRERLLLMLALAIIISIIGWFYLWKPLVTQEQKLNAALANAFSVTAQLNEAETFLTNGQQNKGSVDRDTAVQILIAPELKRFGLDANGVLLRAETKNTDEVILRFQGARLDQLMRFIGACEQSLGLKVAELALTPETNAGLSNVFMILSR